LNGGGGGGGGGCVSWFPSFTDSLSLCHNGSLCLDGTALRNHIEVSLPM